MTVSKIKDVGKKILAYRDYLKIRGVEKRTETEIDPSNVRMVSDNYYSIMTAYLHLGKIEDADRVSKKIFSCYNPFKSENKMVQLFYLREHILLGTDMEYVFGLRGELDVENFRGLLEGKDFSFLFGEKELDGLYRVNEIVVHDKQFTWESIEDTVYESGDSFPDTFYTLHSNRVASLVSVFAPKPGGFVLLSKVDKNIGSDPAKAQKHLEQLAA